MPGLLIQGGMGAGTVGSPYATGLTAFWKLADLTDSSGSGYTLTNSNVVTFPANNKFPTNAAAFFVIATNQALTLANTADVTMAGDRTITGWFNATAIGTSMQVLSKDGITPSSTREYQLAISAGGTLSFTVFNTSGTLFTANGPNIVAGRWFFFAATYNSTTKVINLYANSRGNLPTPGTATLTGTPRTGTVQNFAIGNSSANNRAFGGSIPYVRWYSSVLTLDQINTLYWGGIGQ